MSTVKLVALDVDGTLLNSRGEVTPRVRRAVTECRDRGIIVILATGRPFIHMKELAKDLSLHGPAVLNSGTIIRQLPEGRIMRE